MTDSLQETLKQNVPFVNLDMRTIVATLRAAAVLQELMRPFFKQFGITHQQFNVLRILRGAGEGGLPSLEIPKRMVQRVPDTTRILRRLESAGMLKRRRCSRDRRVIFVQITEKSLDLLASMDGPLLDIGREICRVFTPEEQQAFNDLLDSFSDR